jgi:hypothetical protein
MKGLEIELEDRPGALAAMGDALGGAGVSVEGGGAFTARWPRYRALPLRRW